MAPLNLQQHLSHSIPYRRKHPIKLHPHARRENCARHICFTCGVGYNGREGLGWHLDRSDHRREGMVSRWEEDQHWLEMGGKGCHSPPTSLSFARKPSNRAWVLHTAGLDHPGLAIATGFLATAQEVQFPEPT